MYTYRAIHCSQELAAGSGNQNRKSELTAMNMEDAIGSGTAQGDLADVVARAGAMAALPSTSPPSSFAAADHSMSCAAMADQIVMNHYEEDSLLPVMFEAPPTVDPAYLSSSLTAPRGGYWLPPQQLAVQISQHACYGRDMVMSADFEGDDAMRSSSPVMPAAAYQMMKRKNDVKKVVCIPAPPATSSRPSGGEVIPSDLWAWRKYGQKPIKGSPYPRYICRARSASWQGQQIKTMAILEEGQLPYS